MKTKRIIIIAGTTLLAVVILISVIMTTSASGVTTTTTGPVVNGKALWSNTEAVNKVKLGNCYEFKWELSAGGKDLTYTSGILYVKWDMDGDLSTTADIITTHVSQTKINPNGSMEFNITGKYPLDAWVDYIGVGIIPTKTPELNLNSAKKIDCTTTTGEETTTTLEEETTTTLEEETTTTLEEETTTTLEEETTTTLGENTTTTDPGTTTTTSKPGKPTTTTTIFEPELG
jgi:hypothetical protein